ncbi:MAG TPA: 50S ribosomal protein L22 [Actinomycetota bacterium]
MANATKEARASVKYARLSPNKARFVLNQIRGLHVDEARRVLQFSRRGAAEDVVKVLEAAVANAEHGLNSDRESLFVARCWADEGPTLQRWRPRAQGRAYRIRKRTTHITVVVEERE